MSFEYIDNYIDEKNQKLKEIGYEIHPKLFTFITGEQLQNPGDLNNEDIRTKYDDIWYNEYRSISSNLDKLMHEYLLEKISEYNKMGINLGYFDDGTPLLDCNDLERHIKGMNTILYDIIFNEIGDAVITSVHQYFYSKLYFEIPFWKRTYHIKTSKYNCHVSNTWGVVEFFKVNLNNLGISSCNNDVEKMRILFELEKNLPYSISSCAYNNNASEQAHYTQYIENITNHLALKEILENSITDGTFIAYINDGNFKLIKD